MRIQIGHSVPIAPLFLPPPVARGIVSATPVPAATKANIVWKGDMSSLRAIEPHAEQSLHLRSSVYLNDDLGYSKAEQIYKPAYFEPSTTAEFTFSRVYTIRHIDNPKSRYPNAQVLNQKAFNEARRLHFAEGSTEAGPWLNPHGVYQAVGTPKTSKRLAENMQRAYGYTKIPYGPAHHIIPKGEDIAQPLRNILARHNIDLDDCSNGTFMTTNTVKTNLGDWSDDLGHNHQNHPRPSPYITKMLADLEDFELYDPTPANRDKLKDALQKIASQLADGSYPWP